MELHVTSGDSCDHTHSLLCGILIFSTVFSVQADKFGYDTPEIVALLKENGPANTGLTFIW